MPAKVSILDHISQEEYKRMMVCFHAIERSYMPGEIITTFGQGSALVGILLDGEAVVMRTHFDGRQTILEQLEEGDIFGETLSAAASETSLIQIISYKRTRIQFIDYGHLVKRCSNACSFHSQLVSNALMLISQKAVQLSERLDILSQRTIRDKLLSYFSLLSKKNKSESFDLPFTMSDLADYLSVDRSAMMRELKKMREEGLVNVNKRAVTFPADM